MSGAEKNHVLPLPKVMDRKAARRLASDLLAAKGKPVTLDASHVQRVGGQCLQVMLSAQRSWMADDLPFVVTRPSPLFSQCMRQLGAREFLSGDAP
ncbi:MAG TPA: STAS domain-containing protein [Rhizomicrobium sp.]